MWINVEKLSVNITFCPIKKLHTILNGSCRVFLLSNMAVRQRENRNIVEQNLYINFRFSICIKKIILYFSYNFNTCHQG